MSHSELSITPLISADEIARRLPELAHDIHQAYEGKKLTVVAVLEGAFIFAADIIRLLPEDWDIHFISIRASSYLDDLVSGGKVHLEKETHLKLEGRDVLIIDDILDTGLTLKRITEVCKVQNPASIKNCVLLKKKQSSMEQVWFADWFGFEIEDNFVVGYGLDAEGRYRHLPYIGIYSG